jgi:predicted nucleic acid-binding protein
VREAGSEEMHRAHLNASSLLCVGLGYVEATSVLARMRKGRKITPTQLRDGGAELERLWRWFNVHATSEALIDRAARVAQEDALRAYDAVHLAAALSFAQDDALEFACWDRELREVAASHGLALIPVSL